MSMLNTLGLSSLLYAFSKMFESRYVERAIAPFLIAGEDCATFN
jgi:hypothetical protein